MLPPSLPSRRHFFCSSALNLGGVALAWLLNQEGVLGAGGPPDLKPKSYDLLPKSPWREPRATAMIQLFMQGGPSHIDLLERKPELEKYEGQPYPGELKLDSPQQLLNKLMPSPWKFRRYGDSGLEISSLLPHLGSVIDDVCVVRSMRTAVNNHLQSTLALNTGRIQAGRPSLGSWLTYGLGTVSQNLPAFVSMPEARMAVGGVANWSNGWLPSLYQGTAVRSSEPRMANLEPPTFMQGDVQDRYLSLVEKINRTHLDQHPGELDLEARIAGYELAARMQTSANEALDLSQETAATKKAYGFDDPEMRDFGARCLIARRLIERGVRFVQITTGGQFWDHHARLMQGMVQATHKVDQPSAALVKDLKERGLLDTTIVAWGGEMGRLPVIQNGATGIGRDHNTYGFSMWLAGGGIRGGMAYGATDEFGYNAVDNVVHHYDYLATILHQFGLDASQLVYKRNARELTLVDGQPARVVHDILLNDESRL